MFSSPPERKALWLDGGTGPAYSNQIKDNDLKLTISGLKMDIS